MTPAGNPQLGFDSLSHMMTRNMKGESLRRNHGGEITERNLEPNQVSSLVEKGDSCKRNH